MERVIKKDTYGNIACNNILIHTKNGACLGDNIKNDLNQDWKIIEPKYYIYRDDNAILEIWYNNKGMLLNGTIEGYINDYWTDELREEITYEEAMLILEQKQNKDLGYNNKDLMSRVITNVATAGLDCTKDDMVDAMKFCFYEKENKFFDNRNFPFWLKVIAGNERPIGTIFYVKDELTRYKKEDVELYTGYIPSFAEDDLIDKLRGTKKPIGWEKLNYQLKGIIEESKGNLCCETEVEKIKQNNNGGASDWYSLPKDANTLQDLIEHRNMNGSVKDIFKACYRLGIKTEDELRDLNKMAYYSLREVGRITGRKDYITIAKELMGSQANEKDENEI